MTSNNHIFPNAVDQTNSNGVNRASHGRYYHLHFDIRAAPPEAHEALGDLVGGSGESLRWTNFARPAKDELQRLLKFNSTETSCVIDKLADPDRCGAPMAHLSAKKQFVGATSLSLEHQQELFVEGAEAMASAGLKGYAELEEISVRHVLPSNQSAQPQASTEAGAIPISPFELVALDHPTVDRDFRTTEIHCTFERLEGANLQLVEALLDAGFYTAFLRHANGGLKLILTIQGFDPDVGLLYGVLLGWLMEQASGAGSTAVTLKKEDIVAYALVGDRSECDMQRVIQPLSLVGQLGERLQTSHVSVM